MVGASGKTSTIIWFMDIKSLTSFSLQNLRLRYKPQGTLSLQVKPDKPKLGFKKTS
jgi:hypothetical protein